MKRDIPVYSLGEGRRTLLLVGAHHAMEHICASVLSYALLSLCENFARHTVAYGHDTGFLLKKYSFCFVPCLNPDGVRLHLLGEAEGPLAQRQMRMSGGDFSDWQANARGVDLNHNYDYRFFEYKSHEAVQGILPGKTRYSGEYPESEPESAALAAFTRALSPALVLSFHTQGELVYYRPRGSERAKRIAKRTAELLNYELSTPEGLADFGGFSDYVGEVLGIPSLTVELGLGKNPLPQEDAKKLAPAVLRLLYSAPHML